MLRFLLNAEAGGSGAVNSASTLSDQGIGQSLSASKHSLDAAAVPIHCLLAEIPCESS
jgi:hypothetical protein